MAFEHSSKLVLNSEIPADVPDWVMVARVGNWSGHPAGPERVTADLLHSALDYFDRHYHALGTDLVIDYHHGSVLAVGKGQKAPAAGWIDRLELRADGAELWGHVKLWTTEARNAITAREYRYLSPTLRWNRPDPVTGAPVPLALPSVALTNTPFMTALEGLNESSATDGGAAMGNSNRGGRTMPILNQLAEALNQSAEQVASALGLKSQEDKDVAEVINAMPGRIAELEAAAGRPASDGVLNALGCQADADETAVKAAVLRLKAPGAGMDAVKAALGLDASTQQADMLNAIAALEQTHRKSEAQALVDGAIEAGKIPPANKDFWLNAAQADPAAAKAAVESLPVITRQTGDRINADPQGRQLTDAEDQVCRMLGLAREEFLTAAT